MKCSRSVLSVCVGMGLFVRIITTYAEGLGAHPWNEAAGSHPWLALVFSAV